MQFSETANVDKGLDSANNLVLLVVEQINVLADLNPVAVTMLNRAAGAGNRFWILGLIQTTAFITGDTRQKRAVLTNHVGREKPGYPRRFIVPVDNLLVGVDQKKTRGNGFHEVFE